TGIATFPVGACVGPHTHPGLETSYMLEGEVTLKIDGKPDQKVKAGESLQIPTACTVVAARRRTSPSVISEQRSRPPMSATKALTRSRKRRAVAERPSRPGNRSLWFVTAERVREGSSHKGDDAALIIGRSWNIPASYARYEHKSS